MSEITPKTLDDETLALINSEVAAILAQQADDSAKIETKAVVLVGYAGALSAFLATRHSQPLLAIFAYIAYAITAGLGITAFMAAPRLRSSLAPRTLFANYADRTYGETLAALAATRVKIFESNGPGLQTKARIAQMSLAALVLGVPLMVAAIIVTPGHA